MANNKKSFLLYCDLIHTVSKMPKEKAGELFIHILEYVNDKNPETDDLIIQLTFEPIKQALKRDLKKYEKTLEEKSINGRIGNIKRWNVDLYDMIINETITLEEAENIAKYRKASLSDKTNRNPSQPIAKIADIDNDSVIDNVIDINIVYDEFIEEVKNGNHEQAIDLMYSNLKLKKGSLSPLLKEFKGQLVISNKLHKNTISLREHFYSWLNKQDQLKKLDQYKLKQ